ncbi:MAG TPA: hypothetical protein ENH11_02780, partial [Candidatus Acetothermia bacterium]|nr:hypothetical protein [Candidatus Acetothermia bacterium]
MAKTNTTTAVATREQTAVSLRGELTEKQFATLVANQVKRFKRIKQVQADSNKRAIPLYWDSGAELKKMLFASTEPKLTIIRKFADFAGISQTSLCRALNLSLTYTRERVLWLVE